MLTYADLRTLRNQMLSTLKRLPDGASPDTIADACAMATVGVIDGQHLIVMPVPLHNALRALDLPRGSTEQRLDQALSLAGEAIKSLDALDTASVKVTATLSERVRSLIADHDHHRDLSTRMNKRLIEVSQERDQAIAARNHLESTMTEDADIERLDSIIDYWKERAENRYVRIDILEGENKRLRATLLSIKDAADTVLAVRAAEPLT